MEPNIDINKRSSKKIVFIAIIVVVLAIIGWFMMGRGEKAVTGVNVDRKITGETTYSNEQGSVTVGANKLPDNWPSDAPKYKNSNIQYSGTSNPQTGEQGFAVVFTTTDSYNSVIDFYKKELASKGWTVEQTANVGNSTIIAAKKDTRTFGAQISNIGNGQVTVTVGIGIPK